MYEVFVVSFTVCNLLALYGARLVFIIFFVSLLKVEEDWVQNREEVIRNELDDDVLPLDMLDADIDWEKSAFAAKVKRLREGKIEN